MKKRCIVGMGYAVNAQMCSAVNCHLSHATWVPACRSTSGLVVRMVFPGFRFSSSQWVVGAQPVMLLRNGVAQMPSMG